MRMASGFEIRPVLPVAYGNDAKPETVHPHTVHRLLLIAPLLATHEEIPGRDRRALRLGKPRHYRILVVDFRLLASVLNRQLLHFI
jgi:hypothetical protein